MLLRNGFRSASGKLFALVFFDGRIDDRAAVQAFPGVPDQKVVSAPLLDHPSLAFGAVHRSCLKTPATLSGNEEWEQQKCRKYLVNHFVMLCYF